MPSLCLCGLDSLLFGAMKYLLLQLCVITTETQRRHTFPPHGLSCRNAKPNNSLDFKYFEVSTNKALVSEQTLLELNLF